MTETLRCAAMVPQGWREQIHGHAELVCGEPIRLREGGSCVFAIAIHLDGRVEYCEGLPEEHGRGWTDWEHVYQPGYEHVDLEGACTVCGGTAKYTGDEGPEHDFTPPVVDRGHEPVAPAEVRA